jgi:hypothetical protein
MRREVGYLLCCCDLTLEQGKLSQVEGELLGFYMWALQFWSSNPTASTTTYLQLHKFLQQECLDAGNWGCISFASACALAEVHALHYRASKNSSTFRPWNKIAFTQAAPNGIADFGGCAFVCSCRCQVNSVRF